MKSILIVEDEYIEAKNLQVILQKAGYHVCGMASSVIDALAITAQNRPDFVLIDIFLKGQLNGIDLAKKLAKQNIPFLYVSANSSESTLAQAKETRPYGFLVKPFREKDVLIMLDIAIYQLENRPDDKNLRPKYEKAFSPPKTGTNAPAFPGIIGKSESLMQTLRLVSIVAPSETPVLILGESGTGKEAIAQAIHNNSPRKDKPFIKVNCGALPAPLIESILFGHEKGSFTSALNRFTGKFEQADTGSLFLDEVAEIPVDIQVKLLRALQEMEIERLGGARAIKINVRIIAATNRNIEKDISEGRFRIDLYYRLNGFPIVLAPLRDRQEDIPLLTNFFKEDFCKKEGKASFDISPGIMNRLINYRLPGNVRELESLVRRLVLFYDGVNENELETLLAPWLKEGYGSIEEKIENPGADRFSFAGKTKTLEENEREYIMKVLRKCNSKVGGKNGAAKLLNLPPTTLESKIRKLGIDKLDLFERGF